MLCFPWVVGWVRSQEWQPDNSSKAAAMWAKSAMEKQGRMKGYENILVTKSGKITTF